jgi:hypothetical protein
MREALGRIGAVRCGDPIPIPMAIFLISSGGTVGRVIPLGNHAEAMGMETID